jgi:hypothetical protein
MVRHLLGDHQAGEVRVSARHLWHDGAVDYPQALDAEHPAFRVNHCPRVVRRAHPAGSGEMPGVGYGGEQPGVDLPIGERGAWSHTVPVVQLHRCGDTGEGTVLGERAETSHAVAQPERFREPGSRVFAARGAIAIGARTLEE